MLELGVPTRKRSLPAALRQDRRPKPAPRRRVNDIVVRRDRLVSALASLRERDDAPSPSVEKALTLLTRWWSGADWSAREELLNAAEWLVRLERMRGRDLPAPA